jgi:pyruvate dehydrogenase E1 component alpha subunit
MHLFSRDHCAASSGIVGASGPAGVGFALAAQYLREGTVAVAFFGEGAMNQGMLMESLNLAAVWKLPVLFVCKDDDWSITAKSHRMSGGNPFDRAHALGVNAVEADGRDVVDIHEKAGEALERVRAGYGPAFIRAECVHLEGHFLGFELLQTVRSPLTKMPKITAGLTRAAIGRRGGPIGDRVAGLKDVTAAMVEAARDPRAESGSDPVARVRESLFEDDIERVRELEAQIVSDVNRVVNTVREDV